MPVTLISTCKAFAERTLPVVCGSLDRAGVKDYVIVGDGFSEPTFVAGHKVNPAPVAGLWDMTALPFAVSNLQVEWFFLLSDTCLVGLGYPAKLSALAADSAHELIGLRPDHLMCFMGLYRRSYIERNLARIVALAGMSKRALVGFENDPAMISWASSYYHAPGALIQFDYQFDPYNVGRLRWHRYFGAFGVTKWTVEPTPATIDEGRAKML